MSDRTCSVDGCTRRHYAKGWCEAHYSRWKKHRGIQAGIPVAERNPRDGTCRVEGCDRPIGLRRLCVGHARREDKHGDVMADIPLMRPSDGTCSVEGCVGAHEARGWCGLHYKRFRLYKLTPDDYAMLLAAQGGGCAICGTAPTDEDALTVDHDHACCPGRTRSCGKCVRGLLCIKCNVMLGGARDDTATLRRGIEYLTARRSDGWETHAA